MCVKRNNRIQRIVSLLLAMTIVMLMFPRRAYAANGSTAPDRDRIIVSLGDSYSSGEGNDPFYGEDDFREMMESGRQPSSWEDYDFLAHRSTIAWPGQLKLDGVEMKKKRGTQWFFAASSGAQTYDLYNYENMSDSGRKMLSDLYAREIRKKDQSEKGFFLGQETEFRIELKRNGQYLAGTITQPPQFDIFDDPALIGKTVDYVTITIGGNDAGFGNIMAEAVGGSTYLNFSNLESMVRSKFDDYDNCVLDKRLEDKLIAAYKSIEEKAPNAQIIVVGYPELVDETGKGLFISAEEAHDINEGVEKFDTALSKLVPKCGQNFHYVSVFKKFKGHGAASKNPYVRRLDPKTKNKKDLKELYQGIFSGDGTFRDKLAEHFSAYSYHPNEKGIEIYRKCVQDEIDDQEGKHPVSSPPTSPPDTTTDVSKELPPSQPPTSTPTPPSTPSPQPDLSHVVEDAWSGECVYSVNDGQGGRSTKTAVYHVPKINLDFTNAQAINEEILENFSQARDESDAGYPLTGSDPAFLSVDYEWSVKGNIISLLVTCWRDVPDVPGYYLYTLYVDTGKEVPKGDIIRVAGITEQDYCTRVKEALGSVFWDQSFGPGTEYDLGTWQRYKSYLEDTISQDNVDMAQPFFNENGELCVLGHAFYDAGKNPHDTLVNLENYVLSPYYAETIPMPENTTVVSDKYIVNVANAAYFRSTPSESEDNVICTIPLNTEVGFIEVTDNVFSRVEYNGQYGYVKSEFLGNFPEMTPITPTDSGQQETSDDSRLKIYKQWLENYTPTEDMFVKYAIAADVTHDGLDELILVEEGEWTYNGYVMQPDINGSLVVLETLHGGKSHVANFFGWYLIKDKASYSLIKEDFYMWQSLGTVETTEYYLDDEGNRIIEKYYSASSHNDTPVSDAEFTAYTANISDLLHNAMLLGEPITNGDGIWLDVDDSLLINYSSTISTSNEVDGKVYRIQTVYQDSNQQWFVLANRVDDEDKIGQWGEWILEPEEIKVDSGAVFVGDGVSFDIQSFSNEKEAFGAEFFIRFDAWDDVITGGDIVWMGYFDGY